MGVGPVCEISLQPVVALMNEKSLPAGRLFFVENQGGETPWRYLSPSTRTRVLLCPSMPICLAAA